MAPEKEKEPLATTRLTVFIPKPGSVLAESLLPGSAICGKEEGNRVLIDYEGNRFGAVNMQRYEDKLLHAAGRHVTSYPTVARRLVGADEVIPVGTYEYETRALEIEDRDALLGWTGEDGYPGA